jgi:hypothetical protein
LHDGKEYISRPKITDALIMTDTSQVRLSTLEREVSRLREANQALARYIRACAGGRDTTPEIERLISKLEGQP